MGLYRKDASGMFTRKTNNIKGIIEMHLIFQ